MLKEQIKQQIATDAEELTRGFKDTNNYEAGIIQGYKEGYEDAGDKYAALWQAAEEKAARYEKALKDIANPMAYLQRKAEEEGSVLNGMAFQVANDPAFIKSIAIEALTPKTGEE